MGINFFPALPKVERPAPVIIAAGDAASLAGWLGIDEQIEMGLDPASLIEAVDRARSLGCDHAQLDAIKAHAEAARAIGHAVNFHDVYLEESVRMGFVCSEDPADCPEASWTASNAYRVLNAIGLVPDQCGEIAADDLLARCRKALAEDRFEEPSRLSTLCRIALYAQEKGVPVCWG